MWLLTAWIQVFIFEPVYLGQQQVVKKKVVIIDELYTHVVHKYQRSSKMLSLKIVISTI